MRRRLSLLYTLIMFLGLAPAAIAEWGFGYPSGWAEIFHPVTIPDWDRQGLERLVRYCARPAFSQQRLGMLDPETLVYTLCRPTPDGKTELLLTPIELLTRLADLISPPRLHKHRYCGVLAPRAKLHLAVVASAGPAGATLQLLEEVARKMDMPAAEDSDDGPGHIKSVVSRGWAKLLARMLNCYAIPPSAMANACRWCVVGAASR